jgi:hypothetical protein
MMITGAAPGPTAGPAGEITAVQLVRSYPGWWTSPLGIENRLGIHVLDIGFMNHVSWAIYPDHVCYRRRPQADIFAMNVTGQYIPRAEGHQLDFAIKPAAVSGLIAFSNATHMQAVHVAVPWDPRYTRVIRPFQVEAFSQDSYGNFVVDASEFPLLSDWMDRPEPYVGGALWAPRPVLPPASMALALPS